jgi:formylglycine-generating enzyme required for sulfatase activity
MIKDICEYNQDWGNPHFREDAWYLPDEPLLGFVEITVGSFWMGSDDEDKDAQDYEKSKHEIELPTYYMARYPVTVAQFKAFVEDKKYSLGDPKCLEGNSNHPVVYVTWHDALSYCDWLDERLHRGRSIPQAFRSILASDPHLRVSLPSEAEWEKAARGTDGRIYPWGELPDPAKTNTSETKIGGTSAVCGFAGGASPYGLLDMSGNVFEWTRSLWGKDVDELIYGYPYSEKMVEREDLKTGDDIWRVLRGGSFYHDARCARCAYRRRYPPYSCSYDRGFRVALTSF